MAEKATIDITVSPKSSKSMIKVDGENGIRVYLNSPPVDGKANSECIKLLSKKLHIAKSSINIGQGEKGRKKRIIVNGMSLEEVMELLKK